MLDRYLSNTRKVRRIAKIPPIRFIRPLVRGRVFTPRQARRVSAPPNSANVISFTYQVDGNDMKLAGKNVLVTGGSAGLVLLNNVTLANREGCRVCTEVCR